MLHAEGRFDRLGESWASKLLDWDTWLDNTAVYLKPLAALKVSCGAAQAVGLHGHPHDFCCLFLVESLVFLMFWNSGAIWVTHDHRRGQAGLFLSS